MIRPNQTTIVVAIAIALSLSVAKADVQIFFLDQGDQEAWNAALDANRQVIEGTADFASLPDCGIIAFDGPLGNAGAGPIDPGIIPESLVFDSNMNPFGEGGPSGRGPGGTGLRCVGPSAGFGNPENAILAGVFPDSFDIISDLPHTAMEMTVSSFLGADVVVVTIYDPEEVQIAQFHNIHAPSTGNRIGILTTDGDQFGRVNIYDGSGAEGIIGKFDVFTTCPATSVPIVTFDVQTGVVVEGSLNDLCQSDDSRLVVRSGLGSRLSESHKMELVVDAIAEQPSPEFLRVRIESSVNVENVTARVRLWNWRTERYENVSTYQIGPNEETVDLGPIDVESYVRVSGAIRMSIQHIVVRPFIGFRFDSSFDQIELSTE